MTDLQEKIARAGKYIETVQQQEQVYFFIDPNIISWFQKRKQLVHLTEGKQVIERLEAMLDKAMGEARDGRKVRFVSG